MLHKTLHELYLPGVSDPDEPPLRRTGRPGRQPGRYLVGAGVGGMPTNTAGLSSTGVREGRTGEQIVGAAHGGNFERASRGKMFIACDQGAGVAVGTTLSTTAILSLYNPANSGIRIAIKRVWAVYFSGTLGTGVLYHCVNSTVSQAAPSSGSLLTATSCDVGGAQVAQGVARTGSTVVAPVAVAPLAYLPPELATTVTALQQDYEDLDDLLVLEPGTSYQLQAVAASGTSPKVSPAIAWEEVPLTV